MEGEDLDSPLEQRLGELLELEQEMAGVHV
jgi:hypothetical protein